MLNAMEDKFVRLLNVSTLLAAMFFVVGCTTYSRDHYVLMAEPESHELQGIADQIFTAVEPVLVRHGLQNVMHEGTSDSVMFYYSTGGGGAVRAGVRIHDGMVILDTFQTRGGAGGDSPEYARLRDELIEALGNVDGVELVEMAR
ncbi:hypothetical protein E4656_01200 [Natronospirillum operosum]|uniref:DUF3568 family protein n=1 Tax=Natronospirillum operosum TaxID=2759953 RepID=A0A4Z0WIV3_9GAMM|nr:hypothetical protein [Natronospirillum operosum]TGG95075.1 hypothetical protein E4656_01200 [Natronospirillum operosum]